MAVIFSVTACGGEKKGDIPGGNSINGTDLISENNLVGIVKNSVTGEGIPDVPVTDGFTFTTTDANGVYQFTANRYCRNVYISVPAGYKIPVSADSPSIPRFYSTSTIDKYKVNRNDFVLEPLGRDEQNFTLIMIGDPQCKTDSDVERYRNETIPDIKGLLVDNQPKGKYLNAYAMTLGDLTFDNVKQWDNVTSTMSKIGIGGGEYLPVFQCIGNHDHDAAESNEYNATKNYIKRFGPTDYSFDRGKVHFVVMDNVQVTENQTTTWNYKGGFTASQLAWLKADLALVKNKEDKMIIFSAHMPFRGTSESSFVQVLKLMSEFKEAHLMIGHTHYHQAWVHNYKSKSGMPVYEHIHGAACGAWWTSNSNVLGAPNGYSVYEIEGNTIKNWLAKGTNTDSAFQMRVYDGNDVYTGSANYSFNWYTSSQKAGSVNVKGNIAYKGCFVAEVFNDDDTYWTVEMFKDGVKVGDFVRMPNGGSCNVAAASFWFNEKGKYTSTWASTTASHYWYFKPDSGNPSSEKNWTVRATQTIPGSGIKNVYECNALTKNISTVF